MITDMRPLEVALVFVERHEVKIKELVEIEMTSNVLNVSHRFDSFKLKRSAPI